MQLQFVGFTGRARQLFGMAELLACLLGVIAQEVDRFAHFGNTVGQALASFLDAQCHELRQARFELVRRVFQDRGAAGGRGAVPGRLRGHGVGQGLLHGGTVGRLPLADDLAGVGRVGHVQQRSARVGTGHQRRGMPPALTRRGHGRVELLGQSAQIVVVGEIDAHGVLPVMVLAAQQIDRQRDFRMRDGRERGDHVHRIADQVVDGHVLVGDAVDEAGIGAVFEQAAHQVRQQVFMRTDRRVHAARYVQTVGRHHFGIQVIAHAVQLLVLVLAALGDRLHRCDGVRVVRGEHRVDRIAVREQTLGTGQVGDVGVLLAGEHRVGRQALDLRALDLRIPVRALDQAHLQATTDAAGQIGQVVDRVQRALLVRLHDHAEAFPAGERGIADHRLDDVQRQLQAVGLFGIDGAADAVGLGQLSQFQYARHQVGHHACALGMLVARVQRGELDRDARCRIDIAVRAAAACLVVTADRVDRATVILQVTLGVLHGQRAFAEHVERIAVAGVVALVRARQRFVDGAAHDELVAHDLHRLAHCQADHRLTHATDQALERARHIGAGGIVDLDQAAGQHQAPGGGVYQHRVAAAHVLLPVRIAELVADQLVGRLLVRNAQQRFGHAHQQHAFLAAQIVLAHEGFDRALVLGTHAHPLDQVGGGGLHPGLFGGGKARLLQQLAHMGGLVLQPGIGDRLAERVGNGRQLRREQRRAGGAGRCRGRGKDRGCSHAGRLVENLTILIVFWGSQVLSVAAPMRRIAFHTGGFGGFDPAGIYCADFVKTAAAADAVLQHS